jgi:hypothetical protein
MEKISQRGGKRANAGRKVNVANKLVLFEVALSLGELRPCRSGVSYRQAQTVVRKRGAASVIGKEREAFLRELGSSDEAEAYLRIQRTCYLAKRYTLGFDS